MLRNLAPKRRAPKTAPAVPSAKPERIVAVVTAGPIRTRKAAVVLPGDGFAFPAPAGAGAPFCLAHIPLASRLSDVLADRFVAARRAEGLTLVAIVGDSADMLAALANGEGV